MRFFFAESRPYLTLAKGRCTYVPIKRQWAVSMTVSPIWIIANKQTEVSKESKIYHANQFFILNKCFTYIMLKDHSEKFTGGQQVGLKTSRWPAPLICWYWPAFLSPGPFPLLQAIIITNQIDNSLCTFILYNIQCILYIVYCAWSFVAVENTCSEMGQTAGLR